MPWHMHLGHMRALSRKTKQEKREKNNKRMNFPCLPPFPSFISARYITVHMLSLLNCFVLSVIAITAITILYYTVVLYGTVNPRWQNKHPLLPAPIPQFEHSDLFCFSHGYFFPSGSSHFPSPGYSQTFFAHPGCYVICGRDCRYVCLARQETQQKSIEHSRLGPVRPLLLTHAHPETIGTYCTVVAIVATTHRGCTGLEIAEIDAMQV